MTEDLLDLTSWWAGGPPLQAQQEYFERARAALEQMMPAVVELRARSEQYAAAAGALHSKLAAVEQTIAAAEPTPGGLSAVSPPPAGKRLEAALFCGRKLGPPQRQGYLYRHGSRRWCVLLNGVLLEYGDSWSGPPAACTQMFLCTAKPVHDVQPGSKQAFELRGAQGEPVVYQALSEDERGQWLRSIQDCTAYMITNQPAAAAAAAGGEGAASEAGEPAAGTQPAGTTCGEQADRRMEDQMASQLELLQRADNSLCADCSAPGPDWVSTALGCLICVQVSAAAVHVAHMDYDPTRWP